MIVVTTTNDNYTITSSLITMGVSDVVNGTFSYQLILIQPSADCDCPTDLSTFNIPLSTQHLLVIHVIRFHNILMPQSI